MRPALLALMLAAAVPAGAADFRYTASELFDHVLKAQEEQGSYEASITKSEGPVGLSPTSVSEGTMRVAPGGLARLEIRTPSPGLIVSDGTHLWVELTEVNQVLRYDAAKLKESGNFFLDLPSSIRHYSKASHRHLMKPGEGFDPAHVSALELLPLKPSQAGFERLRVWVDERRWVVLRVLLDYGGTRSDVRFDGIKTLRKSALDADPGSAPDPALFQYTPPKGFELFDLDL